MNDPTWDSQLFLLVELFCSVIKIMTLDRVFSKDLLQLFCRNMIDRAQPCKIPAVSVVIDDKLKKLKNKQYITVDNSYILFLYCLLRRGGTR